jgi:hypothetical protein
MFKNKILTLTILNKLHKQEKQFKKELAKTFLEYLDVLPINNRCTSLK